MDQEDIQGKRAGSSHGTALPPSVEDPDVSEGPTASDLPFRPSASEGELEQSTDSGAHRTQPGTPSVTAQVGDAGSPAVTNPSAPIPSPSPVHASLATATSSPAMSEPSAGQAVARPSVRSTAGPSAAAGPSQSPAVPTAPPAAAPEPTHPRTVTSASPVPRETAPGGPPPPSSYVATQEVDIRQAAQAPAAEPPKAGEKQKAIMSLRPGGQLGPYELLAQIGEGGMATIFKARHSVRGQVVAIKALHAHQNQNLASKRFMREYRAIRRLNHPNVVQVFDYGEEGGQPFIVMEYVEGIDLKSRLKELRNIGWTERWREVVSLIRQICGALEHIHARGIIHRDLKPSNILLTRNGQAKLSDFGVAKPLDASMQLTQAGMLVGTLAYLAPEVFEQSKLDHRLDLYALGVMIYVMLTDKLPFSGKNIAQLMQKHLKSDPEPPQNINPNAPDYLARIALKLMSKRPEDRYQSAADVLRDVVKHEELAREAPLLDLSRQDEGWVPRLVGRSEAVQLIQDLVMTLAGGKGGLLLVEGPEGAGKSRLVDVGLCTAHARGITIFSGHCLSGGQDWGEGFRKVVDAVAAELERTGEQAEGLVRLRDRFGTQDLPAPAVAPLPQQGTLEQDLISLFRTLTARSPRIVWIDDLDQADGGTLSGLMWLARLVAKEGLPLLLVATLRLSAAPTSLAMTGLLNGEATGLRPRHIRLDALCYGDVVELLESMYPTDPRVGHLARRLFEESDGHPLTVVELIRLLSARGRLGRRMHHGEWRWVMAMGVEEIQTRLKFPAGLSAIMLERLRAYPTQTVTLLRLLAVWGREMRFSTLLRLASASEQAVLTHIDRLRLDGWLSEEWLGGDERYAIAHPCQRASLLGELTAANYNRLRGFIELRLGLRQSGPS